MRNYFHSRQYVRKVNNLDIKLIWYSFLCVQLQDQTSCSQSFCLWVIAHNCQEIAIRNHKSYPFINLISIQYIYCIFVRALTTAKIILMFSSLVIFHNNLEVIVPLLYLLSIAVPVDCFWECAIYTIVSKWHHSWYFTIPVFWINIFFRWCHFN